MCSFCFSFHGVVGRKRWPLCGRALLSQLNISTSFSLLSGSLLQVKMVTGGSWSSARALKHDRARACSWLSSLRRWVSASGRNDSQAPNGDETNVFRHEEARISDRRCFSVGGRFSPSGGKGSLWDVPETLKISGLNRTIP